MQRYEKEYKYIFVYFLYLCIKLGLMADKDTNIPPRQPRKLTLLQYVIYLGVTPCALAALALLVFIIVKGPGKSQPPTSPADTVSDTIY